jgi:hypothetical protein
MQRKPNRWFCSLGDLLHFRVPSFTETPKVTTGHLTALTDGPVEPLRNLLSGLDYDLLCSLKVRATTSPSGHVTPTYGVQGSTKLLSEDIA